MALCFYTGSRTDFNVKKTTRNIGRVLADEFNLHLLTTSPTAFQDHCQDLFTIFGEGYDDTLWGEVQILQDYLSTESPDAITTVVMPHQTGVTAALLAWYYGIPHVYRYTSDDFESYTIYGGWRRPAYFILNNIIGRAALAFSSKYIVLGPNGLNHLHERGISQSDIAILPQPIDSDRFENPPTVSFPVPTDAPVALFVGRRVWVKGFDILEETLTDILDQRSDLHIMLIGSGNVPDIPQRLRDRVHVIGTVDPNIIPAYFNRADVLLVTSRREGLPRVVLEALLAEIPVIAPPVGEIPHIVSDPYETQEEFIHRVCNFEDESVDDVQMYTIEHLRQQYQQFYQQFTAK